MITTMLIALTLPAALVCAQDATATQPVNIYLFWGEGCPHCAKAKPFLEGLDANSDSINLQEYEVYYNANNKKMLQKIVDKLGINADGVPVTIIGDQAFVGYSETSNNQIEARINQCLASNCPDSVAEVIASNQVSNQSKNNTASLAAPLLISIAVILGGYYFYSRQANKKQKIK